ncbi:MAG TPA: shikimate kinase [Tepidisphaeraceae bacterium]|jgi:shikimate kinase|nr:shikimate kinase [Tepidisphaeraceae bacterium]
MTDKMERMGIVLIGYRGSGKSTVGRKLADRLWQECVETDDLIVKRAGKSIKEIFEQDGEPAFRQMESEVLKEVSNREEAVISLGGGALDREENRATLSQAGHKIIYLKCEPPELLRRIQADPHSASGRPNLTSLGGGIEEIEAVLARREPIWRSAMTAELDVTHLTPEEAVVYIVRLL